MTEKQTAYLNEVVENFFRKMYSRVSTSGDFMLPIREEVFDDERMERLKEAAKKRIDDIQL